MSSTTLDPELERGGVFGPTGTILNTIGSGIFTIGGALLGGLVGFDLGQKLGAFPIPHAILTGAGASIGLWAGTQAESLTRPVFYTGAVIVGGLLGPNVAQLLGLGITRANNEEISR